MNAQEQRIAIAEFCGYKLIGFYPHPIDDKGKPVPFYCDDLNAMHEAELELDPHQRQEYVKLLHPKHKTSILLDDFFVASATAGQRAEALLRTIGKWNDRPVPTNTFTLKAAQ